QAGPLLVYERINNEITRIPFQFQPFETFYVIVQRGSESPHLNDSNFVVTSLKADGKLIQGEGYGLIKAPNARIGTNLIKLDHESILKEIKLSSEWKIELLDPNFLLIEPWTILNPLPSKVGLSEKSKKFWKELPLRARVLTSIFGGIVKFTNLFRKKNQLKIARYLVLENIQGLLGILDKILGVNLDLYELYEFFELGMVFQAKAGLQIIPEIPLGRPLQLRATFKIEYLPELHLVYEDLGYPFLVKINGKQVMENPVKQFVWDKSNCVLPIQDYIKLGDNEIIVETQLPDYKTQTPSYHGLEPIAIMGKIGVKKNTIITPPTALHHEDWRKNDLPHYSGKVKYTQEFDLPADYLTRKLFLELTELWNTAEVFLNGKKAGEILWAPYTLDITKFLQQGRNRIEIIVRNTAENFFGVPKKSGIFGTVKIVPYNQYKFYFS
ncbi:MAG TPA: hypothetical protein VMV49_06695, partial [Candidatus Deferrimicrobium sp.]|nr:hypothetical protein [Candidatus Deferrimicrobium sp.]